MAPSAVQRLCTIFAPYLRTSVSPASAYQHAQRPKTTSYKPYYAIKETWTHEFFCISEKPEQSSIQIRQNTIAKLWSGAQKKYASRQRQTIHCLKKT